MSVLRSVAFWSVLVGACAVAVPFLYSYLDRDDDSFLSSPTVSWWADSSDSEYVNYHGAAIFTRFQWKKKEKDADKLKVRQRNGFEQDPERILLFLHGFPTMSMDFADYFGDELQRPALPMAFQSNVSLSTYRNYFSTHFHLLAFDFMGFGLSDKNIGANVTMIAQTDLTEFILNSFAEKIQKKKEKQRKGSRFTTQTSASASVAEETQEKEKNSEEFIRRKTKVEVAIIAHDYGVSIAQELIARQIQATPAASTDSAAMDDSKPYCISSVIFLNGGLFAETHRARPIQRLLITPGIGTVLTFLTNEWLFSRSFTAILGNFAPISKSFLRESWQAIEYKGGRFLLAELQKYIWQRQQHRQRWVDALHTLFSQKPGPPIAIKLLNGPADPVSGRHVAERFVEIYGENKAEIKLLDDRVGHYPQLEDAQTVMKEIQAFYHQVYDRLM